MLYRKFFCAIFREKYYSNYKPKPIIMKLNYVCTAIFLLISSMIYSQKEGDIIKLKTYCKVLKVEEIFVYKNKVKKDDIKTEYIEPNVKYIVNKIGNDSVALIALNFKKNYEDDDTTEEAKVNRENIEIYNEKVYYISKIEFEKSAEIIKEIDRLTVGILTLPFKARPQKKFAFDTEFNLNTTLNWSILNVYNARLNIQGGSGIGNVNLNASNSIIAGDSSQDVTTLSLFTGLMIEYKRVQAGIYVGVDHINNQNQYQWENNGKLWFGFGIGFNVFGITLGEKEKVQ